MSVYSFLGMKRSQRNWNGGREWKVVGDEVGDNVEQSWGGHSCEAFRLRAGMARNDRIPLIFVDHQMCARQMKIPALVQLTGGSVNTLKRSQLFWCGG